MYNFDKKTNRRGIDSLKWDCKENELPMWVADMDIEAPQFIIDSLIKRANIGTYGYSIVPDEYFEAFSAYWKRRHNVDYKVEWMVYSTGIVASISSAVKKLTTPAENVLIQSPVYNCFFSSIRNAGRNILSSDLVYKNGEYYVDWTDLEKKLKDPQTTLMILCNPHNPVGKVWTKDELARIGRLCKENGVIVISDEIHCDFVTPNKHYTPFISASEENKDISITCLSTGKTFNLAGLHSACNVIPNPFLRHKFWRGINTDECGEANFFAIHPNIEALNKGDKWVDELIPYIENNKNYFKNYIEERLPHIHVVPSEATYLLWVDISFYSNDGDELAEIIRNKTGLWVNGGYSYGECGKHFLRINLGTQFYNVKDGASRLVEALKEYEK